MRCRILLSSIWLIYCFIGCKTENIPELKNVVWENIEGISKNTDSNTLIKTSSTGWGNAGASSIDILPKNLDGWVETIIDDINSYRMIGLSEKKKDNDYKSTEYGFYLRQDKKIAIYEKGKHIANVSTYALGDKLKIERKNNVIYYFKNNKIIYTSKNPSIGPLLVDVAMYSKDAKISNTTVFF